MTVIKNKRNKGKRAGPKRDRNREAVSAYAGDAYSLAKRTWTGLNEIRKLINIEEKYLDVNGSHLPDQSGTLTCITQMAQGTTVNTRVGNSIRVQKLELKGRTTVNAATTSFSVVRLIVFRDMEGQGTAPTMADVLETVGTSNAPRQPYDWLNRKRFAILYDELFTVTALTGSSVVKVSTYDRELVKHTLYRGTTAAAASDGEGSIYVGTVSDEATNTPGFTFTTRITYTDD